MSIRLSRPRLAIAALTVCLLPSVAVGCSKSGGTTNAAPSCQSPGVTPTEINVGLIYPDTGPLAPALQDARAGVEARIGLANASGGVNGRKIVLNAQDDGSNAQTFANVARDLVSRQNAFGLIAETLNISAAAGELDRAGIPVTGLPAEPVWTQHQNMFTLSAFSPSTGSVTTFGMYARRLGATRAVLVTDTSSQSTNELAQMLADSLRSQNVEVADTIPLTPDVTSPAAIAQRIRASGADALFGPLAPGDFVAVYDAARSAGVRFKVALNGAGYGSQMLATYGARMAGVSIMVGYTPFSVKSPALSTYEQAMVQYAPESTHVESEVALSTYVTADEFIRGLQLAGACPTRQAFITNLRAIKSYNAGGLIPSIDFSRFGSPNLCYAFVRVNDAGTAFDVVPNTGAADPVQWCGTPIAKH
jgi:ABC-type branched-subunit amino acid transport system substrate-binding protein